MNKRYNEVYEFTRSIFGPNKSSDKNKDYIDQPSTDLYVGKLVKVTNEYFELIDDNLFLEYHKKLDKILTDFKKEIINRENYIKTHNKIKSKKEN